RVPPPQSERPHPGPEGRGPRHLGVAGDQPLPGPQVRRGALAEDGRGRGARLPVERMGHDRARGAAAHRVAPPRLSPRGPARPREGRRRRRTVQGAAGGPRWRARRETVPPRRNLLGGGPERRRGALLERPRPAGPRQGPAGAGLARAVYRTARVRTTATTARL